MLDSGNKCGKTETHEQQVKSVRHCAYLRVFWKSLIRPRVLAAPPCALPSTFPGQSLNGEISEARGGRPGPLFSQAFLSIRDPCTRGADGMACPYFRHLINLISCR